MKNAFRFILVSLLSLALVPSALAKDVESTLGGDICDARPDLCGGPPLKKKRVKKSAKAHREIAKPINDVEEEFNSMEKEVTAPLARTRRPASSRNQTEREAQPSTPLPASVTFESYLHANAAHPAIARRPSNMRINQKAFVAPVVRSTITGSTLDKPTDPSSATPGAPAVSGTPNIGDGAPAADGINPGDAPASSSDGPLR